jgi:Sulfotransferase domain
MNFEREFTPWLRALYYPDLMSVPCKPRLDVQACGSGVTYTRLFELMVEVGRLRSIFPPAARLERRLTRAASSAAVWLDGKRYFGVGSRSAKGLPPILINTMPKSASIYLTRTVASSLGIQYSVRAIGQGVFPTYTMDCAALEEFKRGNIVRQEHFDPTPANLATCAQYVDRIVLHVRDPRQATLSWTHHVRRLLSLHPHSTPWTIFQPPEDYSIWSFDRQLDWQIDRHMSLLVIWLRQWMAAQQSSPLKILSTRYEDFVNDEHAFFVRILKFYDIDAARVIMRPPRKTTKYHYRCGRVDEWKDVFTAEQKARALTMLGPDILERFGWSAGDSVFFGH